MQRIDWSVYQFSAQGLYRPRQSGLAGYVATTLVIEGVSKSLSSSSGCGIRFSFLYGLRPTGTSLPYIRAYAKGSFRLRQGSLLLYVCHFSPRRAKNDIHIEIRGLCSQSAKIRNVKNKDRGLEGCSPSKPL